MAKKILSEGDREAIRGFMSEKALKIEPWCIKAGVSEGTLRSFLAGRTNSMRMDTLRKLAEVQHVTVEQLLGINKPETSLLKITRYIGDLGELHPLAPSEQTETECPANYAPEDVTAAKIIDNSMYPFRQGWIVFYTKGYKKKTQWEEGMWHVGYADDCIDSLCVAELKDGRVMLRTLKRGSLEGRYTLAAHNAPDIENVELTGINKIIYIKPV